MDLIKSKLSENIANLNFISPSVSYLFPCLQTSQTSGGIRKTNKHNHLIIVWSSYLIETYLWAKRAKERARRDWPKTLTKEDSKSWRRSDTSLIGLDSSKLDPAATQHSRNKIDETTNPATRAMIYLFLWVVDDYWVINNGSERWRILLALRISGHGAKYMFTPRLSCDSRFGLQTKYTPNWVLTNQTSPRY